MDDLIFEYTKGYKLTISGLGIQKGICICLEDPNGHEDTANIDMPDETGLIMSEAVKNICRLQMEPQYLRKTNKRQNEARKSDRAFHHKTSLIRKD